MGWVQGAGSLVNPEFWHKLFPASSAVASGAALPSPSVESWPTPHLGLLSSALSHLPLCMDAFLPPQAGCRKWLSFWRSHVWRRVGVLLVPLLLWGCETGAPIGNNATVFAAGEALPAITLVRLDGSKTTLAAYRGKLVVLNAWATWCPPCRREMPSLERLSKTLDAGRFAVLGVSVDEHELGVREYLNDKGVTFAAFIDKNLQAVRDTLGIKIYPTTLLIAPDGRFIGAMVGPRDWDSPAMIQLLEDAYQGKPVNISAIPVSRF